MTVDMRNRCIDMELLTFSKSFSSCVVLCSRVVGRFVVC
jgi:hypothetical protein